MAPLGFYDFNRLLKDSYCVLSDSGTAAEEGLFYEVPNVSLAWQPNARDASRAGETIVSGMDVDNIVESVTTAVRQPWDARYELEEQFSPSSVVINAIRTQITNFFCTSLRACASHDIDRVPAVEDFGRGSNARPGARTQRRSRASRDRSIDRSWCAWMSEVIDGVEVLRLAGPRTRDTSYLRRTASELPLRSQ